MEILEGARRHGVADEDMLHAYRNPIRVFEDDEMIMFIGPDRAGHKLIEVGVSTRQDEPVIAHAMIARPRFVR